MQKTQQFTAVIEREEDMYVALCPELDIASQGEPDSPPARLRVEANFGRRCAKATLATARA